MISMQVFQDEHGLLSSMRNSTYSTDSGEYNDRTDPWCNEIQQNTLIATVAAQTRDHLFRPNTFIPEYMDRVFYSCMYFISSACTMASIHRAGER